MRLCDFLVAVIVIEISMNNIEGNPFAYLTEPNGLCSDHDAMNIDDVEECRATSEALHNQLIELGISQHDDPTQIFANEEVSENYPKGCYLTGSSTYWNNHNTGSRQTGSRSICKKDSTWTTTLPLSTTRPDTIECNIQVNTPGAQLITPNYPNDYPISKDCIQHVKFEEGKAILLSFMDFSLELSFECRYDWLEIHDGGNEEAPLIGNRLCGDSLPEDVTSSKNQLLLKFHSDSSTSQRGYRIKVDIYIAPNCYCENSYGGTDEMNGILCERDGNFKHVDKCEDDEWCTGPGNISTSEVMSPQLKNNFCEKGTLYCGNSFECQWNSNECYKLLFPTCSACPMNDNTTLGQTCSGNCYFDENDGFCKEKDDYVTVENRFVVNETETCKDPYYDTLNEAKIVCDSIKDCIAITQLHCTECYGKSGFGIGKDCNFYYIIRNGQRILETELEGHVSAVYKKKENIAFPADFVSDDHGLRCIITSSNRLKDFEYLPGGVFDATSALIRCKEYCAPTNHCWGCSTDYAGSNRWTAVSDCINNTKSQELINGDIVRKPICVDIKVTTYYDAHLMKWKLGPCSSSVSYKNESEHIERCCIPQGKTILECYNTGKPAGWYNGSIEIQGHRYCQNFAGYKALHWITIIGPALAMPSALPSPNVSTSSIREKCTTQALKNALDDGKDTVCKNKQDTSFCQGLAKEGDCTRKSQCEWMYQNCKESCGFCGVCNSSTNFLCENGNCIEKNKRCNGYCDCGRTTNDCDDDVSDEVDCVYENNIPKISEVKCPENEIDYYATGKECEDEVQNRSAMGCLRTCFCEDHCSWYKCFLHEPPQNCWNGTWIWSSDNNFWGAQTNRKQTKELKMSKKTISITGTVSINEPNLEEEKQSYQTEHPKEALPSKGNGFGEYKAIIVAAIMLGSASLVYVFHSPKKVMAEPKVIFERSKNIFQLSCTALAIYMTVIMIQRFVGNDDTTSIVYRRYNQTPRDQYPTYSICFKGPNLHWYQGIRIWKSYGVTSENYERMLMGEASASMYTYNYTSRLYHKTQATLNMGSDNNITQFHLKITDILSEVEFVTLYSKNTMRWPKISLENPPFSVGYEDPGLLCFTRDSKDYSADTIRRYDLLTFKKHLLKQAIFNHTEMRIFTHYPGQLLRSVDYPIFRSGFFAFAWDSILEFQISDGTILRKRPDSEDPCNSEIIDHDEYILKKVATMIGCIPPYWIGRVSDDSLFDVCTNASKLRQVYGYIRNYQYELLKYDSPCLDMFVASSHIWKTMENNDNDTFIMKVIYNEKHYEEIVYSQSFGFESLVSNIGGFVGIFLGYSMMQIPDVFDGIFNYFTKIKNKYKN